MQIKPRVALAFLPAKRQQTRDVLRARRRTGATKPYWTRVNMRLQRTDQSQRQNVHTLSPSASEK